MIQRIKLAKNEAHTPHPTTLNKNQTTDHHTMQIFMKTILDMKLTDRSAEPVTALDSSKSRAKNQTGKNELQAFTKTPAQEDQISWH
jgi:hypothetical protein